MPNHVVRRRTFAGAVLLCAVLVGAACEPLVNAPPGGGQTVTQTFRSGPFTLDPGEEIQGFPSSGMPRPQGAFGLKGARFNVVDSNGVPVSVHDVHLHHIVMTTSARNDQLCPGRRERFIGAGMERTPITLWGPYTYLVTASEQWGSIYHLMNEMPAGSPPKTVYIQFTLSSHSLNLFDGSQAFLSALSIDGDKVGSITGVNGDAPVNMANGGGPGGGWDFRFDFTGAKKQRLTDDEVVTWTWVGGAGHFTGIGAHVQGLEYGEATSAWYSAVAVPEPGAYAMFLSGLAVLGASALRRRGKTRS